MGTPILNDEPECIVRECRRCEGPYMVSLSEATEIPPNSIINLCSACMTAVFVDHADYQALDEYFDG